MDRLSHRPIPRFALAGALLVTLSACEIRQTSGEEDSVPDDVTGAETPAATPDPSATPETEETSFASILREDVEEDAVTADPPPPPLELVLPFPDGADLSPRAERMLEEVLASDAMAQGWPVTLGGHTDSGGNDQANLRASRSRAETVAAWLVERGVADERITVIAFGEQNPVAPNAKSDGTSNEEGRRANRRVELRIAPAVAGEDAPVAEPSPANTADG